MSPRAALIFVVMLFAAAFVLLLVYFRHCIYLAALLAAFDDEATPYLARTAPERSDWQSDYAHLSRHGEWDDAWEEGT